MDGQNRFALWLERSEGPLLRPLPRLIVVEALTSTKMQWLALESMARSVNSDVGGDTLVAT